MALMKKCESTDCNTMIEHPAHFCTPCKKLKKRIKDQKHTARKKAIREGQVAEYDSTCRYVECKQCGHKFFQTNFQQQFCERLCKQRFAAAKRKKAGVKRSHKRTRPVEAPVVLKPVIIEDTFIQILDRFIKASYDRRDQMAEQLQEAA